MTSYRSLLFLLAASCATRDPSAGAPTAPASTAAPARSGPRPGWPNAGALAGACRGASVDPPPPTWHSEGGHQHDVVVYTAHPDDESMYAGGTLARLASRGRKVAVVIASHGEGGRLLAPLADGGFEEQRDLPLARVVDVRDQETRLALRALGVDVGYLHEAATRIDYGFTTSCEEAMSTWNERVPGGAPSILARLVGDIRARRPRVVVTLDRRDDPGGSLHGHHRAIGALAELAARVASTDVAPELGRPVTVEELLVLAPKDVEPQIVVTVDPATRQRALQAYASQFTPADVSGFGARATEGFVLVWRAAGATVRRHTRLEELLE